LVYFSIALNYITVVPLVQNHQYTFVSNLLHLTMLEVLGGFGLLIIHFARSLIG
jgi:hypothetical protein